MHQVRPIQSLRPSLVLTQTGLDLMEKEASVFQCHNETKRVQTYGIMGASRAIFRAGFSIDSFMMRYQGLDWTNQTNWDCNGR